MEKRILELLEEWKKTYEKTIKNNERMMTKYPPEYARHKEAKFVKDYAKERLEIVNYLIEQHSK